MQQKKDPYLPDERGYDDEVVKPVHAPVERESSKLSKAKQDPIIANNIACMEFDYTEKKWKNNLHE